MRHLSTSTRRNPVGNRVGGVWAREEIRDGTGVVDARGAYLDRSEAELRGLEARLALLETESRHADPGSKIGYANQLEELQEKVRCAAEKIEALRETEREDWSALGHDVRTALVDLKTALDVACTRF
jgi:hypothetical protein